MIIKLMVATASYGDNIVSWGSKQLAILAAFIVAIIVVGMAIKKNVIGALITAAVGAIAVYLVYNPKVIMSIGDALAKIIGLG